MILTCFSNAIDLLCSGQVPKSGVERDDFELNFEEVPPLFTPEEREEWLKKLSEVAVSSDAFFPFSDNVYRLARSGAKYAAAPTGSVNDEVSLPASCEEDNADRKQAVFKAAENLGVTFVEQHLRLFHH